jgi:DNA-binding Lrp family transcriptional regulator
MLRAVPDILEKLSYRELADRLGISPDAARMRAKRKAKSGLWRIIPGNHPSDRVLVEVPANDLGVRLSRGGTVRSAQKAEPTPEHNPNSIAERLLDELAEMRARNEDLTDRLIEAKDVLGTAYNKLITLNQDLVSARIELIAAKDELIAAKDELIAAKGEVIEAKEAHKRDERELAAAEMREMGTKAELERALADTAELRNRLTAKERPWWRRAIK